MDQQLNEQLSEQPVEQPAEVAAPPRPARVRPRRPRYRIKLGKFTIEIGKDVRWYWDIRLWAPLLILLFILALLLPGKSDSSEKVKDDKVQVSVSETRPRETEPPATEPAVRDPEAEALARLADTVGAGRTDNVKTVIMWVAINRSEDHANGYGMSLLDEIARPNQWIFYDENAAYSEGTYLMAEDVLKVARSHSLRPVDNDMLWFVLNDNGSITVRNQFTSTATNKWVEKTIK